MLKLAIKHGEHVQIGDNIKIYNDDEYERQIRIAIDAPREIEIVRSDAKTKEKP